MSTPDSIIIVGAGPTGLALACDLYRRGVPCRVIEAATERSTRSKAIAIWPRVLEILDDLGVADAALDRGIRLDGSTIWSNGRQALSFRLGGLASRFPFGLVLPQYETESILEDRLNALGGKVEHGVECVKIRAADDTVTVTLRHASGIEETRAEWVVGCDGTGSVVRTGGGITMGQRLEPEGWIAADVRLTTTLRPTEVNYFLAGGRVLHVVPMRRGEDGLRWRITMNVGRIRPEPAQWPLDRLAATAAERAAVPVEVTAAEWVTGFRVQQGLARPFRLGRVLVAGDAAHVHSPAGAQGINSGLQDVANLGWKLAGVAADRRPTMLLSTYDVERRPSAGATVRATDRATRMGTLRMPLIVAIRNVAWRFAVRRGWVDRVVAPAMAGLAQRQPRSLLSPGRRRLARVPGPGARLADIATTSPRLWDALGSIECSVLLVHADSGTDLRAFAAGFPPGTPIVVTVAAPVDGVLPTGVHVVLDPDRRVADTLRVGEPTVFVVRPDRYLAVRCPLARASEATRYLLTLSR